MSGKVQKKILSWFLLVVLLLPLLNMKLKLIESGALEGAGLADNVTFYRSKWWDGSYQIQKDKYFNDNIGFRPDLVRVINQLNFSLFDKLAAGGVVMDKDQYLYYTDYIEEYTGQSYAGDDQPRETLTKLKKIQDTLERLDKTIVLVYSPSKPYYFPEHVPGDGIKEGIQTNFKTYFRIGDSLGVHQIDMNRWYASLKNKTRYPLFSKQGIHYTLYGATFAVDSIIRYIEFVRYIKMPHPVYDKIETSFRARRTDDDVGKVLNLMFPIKEKFYYPGIVYKPDINVFKPKTIYIGDSFIWPLLFTGIMNSNTNPEFWYYCEHFYNADFDKGSVCSDMNKYNWQKSMLEADCIIMAYTTTNLVKMQKGFIEKAYEYFYGSKI
jgi:hypothetical protein